MPSLSFAASDQPATVLTPLDALAAELGSEAARIERDLRRDFAVGMAEIRQELEAVQRRGAEMELRAANAERALADAVRERLAAVRNGESVTIEDVRPLVETEVAKQVNAMPKSPDAEAISTIVSIQIEASLSDIAERASALVERPELPMLPDIGAMVSEESDRREGDLVAKVAALVPVPEVDKAIAAEFERQLSDVVIRAVKLIPPVELPDVGAAVADEFVKRESGVAERAAALVKVPEPPDVGEAVAAEVERRLLDIATRSAELIPDVVTAVVEEFTKREDALVERAAALVKVPELPDVNAVVAAEMQNRLFDIAARSVELMPDVGAAVVEEFAKREDAFVERAASLVKVPEAPVLPDIDAKVDNAVAAAFLTVRVPEDGKSADPEATADLVRIRVAEALACVSVDIVSPTDAAEIAQAAIDRALAVLPAGVTIDEMRAVAAAELKQQLEAIPKALDANEIGDLAGAAAEAAVGRYMPDIAQRAATLIPPAEPLPLPDIGGLLEEKFASHADEIAARASMAATDSLTAEIDRLLPEIAARTAVLMPPAEIPEIPDYSPIIEAETERLVAIKIAEIPKPRDGADGLQGPEGPQGTVDKVELRQAAAAATEDHLIVPEHMLGLIGRVGELLSQPFAVALDTHSAPAVLPRRKIIKTKRDPDGNLTYDVTEVSES